MNSTKIEWTDYTWNPISGCTRNCKYCYAKRMANRLKGRAGYSLINPFTPTFHENRLSEPLDLKKSSMIFTCSMGDIFDPHVCEEWRERVYQVIEECPHHVFQILTKQKIIEPLERDGFPKNVWLGVSIDGTSDYWEIPLSSLENCSATIKFISFEPIIGHHIPTNFSFIDWAIIGAQTGPGARSPDQDFIFSLINRFINSDIPYFVKHNIQKFYSKNDNISKVFNEQFPLLCKV